jgi:hypothetical protein
MYVSAMVLMGGPNLIALPICFLIFISLSLLYERKNRFFIGDMKYNLIMYICTVILFASCGVATFLKIGSLATAFIALGGILFVISDNILFAFKYSKQPKNRENVELHVAYYLAQFLIALSIAFC